MFTFEKTKQNKTLTKTVVTTRYFKVHKGPSQIALLPSLADRPSITQSPSCESWFMDQEWNMYI
jgi:hypothetical protein